ncbi:hypothetical protein Hanom_Chr13g01209311 [Helianthus anomalus]
MPQAPIGPKDTLGDIYYKTYTEDAHGDAPHQPPWGLKQKDTFMEFSPCRDWYLNSFPPGEVNRQRARTHDGLYHAYIVREANTRAANHQIVREWRTMVASKDKDLAAKDVEIAELKRRLFGAHDKNESLEIDLEAERVKAATAEEAKQRADEVRDVTTSALNVT